MESLASATDWLWLRGLLSRVDGPTRLDVEAKLTLDGVDVQAVSRVDLSAEDEPAAAAQ